MRRVRIITYWRVLVMLRVRVRVRIRINIRWLMSLIFYRVWWRRRRWWIRVRVVCGM
jgi:hypothetical protein